MPSPVFLPGLRSDHPEVHIVCRLKIIIPKSHFLELTPRYIFFIPYLSFNFLRTVRAEGAIHDLDFQWTGE